MRFITLLCLLVQVLGCAHKKVESSNDAPSSVVYDPLIIECENGKGNSCILMGIKEQNAERAMEYFKKACELKSEVGCGVIIFYLEPQSLTSKDLFARSCYIKKNNLGCHFLATYYIREKKYDLARPLLNQACEKGLSHSCTELLRHAIYQKDRNKILKLTAKTCELGSKETCFLLSQFYSSNQDLVLATKYATIGCDLKDSNSCYLGGLIQQSQGKVQPSLNYLEKSCQLKNEKGCFYLGKILLLLNNENQGIHYLNVSCEKKYSEGCIALANYYQNKNLKNDALLFFVKGCNFSPKDSYNRTLNCLIGAQYMAQFFDTENAIELFEKACKVRESSRQNFKDTRNDACARYAFYKNNRKDLDLRKEYSKKRCHEAKTKQERAYNCYSLACIFALENDLSNSILYLEKAMNEKTLDVKEVLTDFELNNIKNYDEFKSLMRSYK